MTARYITLLGDPVHPTLSEKFAHAAGPRNVALASVACAAFGESPFHAGVNAAIATLQGSAFLMGCQLMESGLPSLPPSLRIGSAVAFSIFDVLTRCIDTQPDEVALAGSRKLHLRAEAARDHYKQGFYTVGLVDSLLVATELGASGNLTSAAQVVLRDIPAYARILAGYRRFDNVVKDKWAIIDMPTPEQVREASSDKQKRSSALPMPA